MATVAEVAALLRSGQRFLLTAHVSPDGDALGSMLAMAHGLRALGKEVLLYDRDPAPPRLAFLPGANELRTTPPTEPGAFAATLVHDCGDAQLLGPAFPPRAVTGPLVVLDHHASVRDFGDVVLRDSSAAAVGVIVARVLAALGVQLTADIAECLWCSLVSDTGWFRYSSTDAEVLRLATACVEAGASPWRFARLSEEESPRPRLELLRLVLGTLEVHGRVALLSLTHAMLAEAGAASAMADGFVNYARGLAGVEVGVLLSEVAGGVRVSLRSKGAVDVGAVATRFGGGGHRAAAGCFIAGALPEARAQLVAALDMVVGAGA